MFCPKCKGEYIKGIAFCPECRVDLVDELIVEHVEDKVMELIDPVEVKFASDQIEAELVMNMLRNNDIQCFSKCREAGDYIKIVAGYSTYGEDIYVDKADYKNAMELLDQIAGAAEPSDEEKAETHEHVSLFRSPQKTARIMIILVFGIPVVLALISYIKNILQ